MTKQGHHNGFIFPEPEIEIGVTGFETDDSPDLLDRTKIANQLSNISNNVDTKMVLAVNGAWGSGKSVFLKLWVQHHQSKHDVKVIYIDAFQADYMNDALSMLVIELIDKFQDDNKELIKNVKKSAGKILRPSLRVALNAIGAILTGLPGTGVVVDSVIDAAVDESENATKTSGSADDNFWDAQIERKRAVENFRKNLKKLVEAQDNKKLVIILDELDRCRPDFALEVLEIAKHLFNVDGLHIILGTNLAELENSVKARYGQGVDASKYLQKFVNVEIRLDIKTPKSGKSDALGYFLDIYESRNAFGINFTDQQSGVLNKIYSIISQSTELQNLMTLRDVETLFARVKLVNLFDEYKNNPSILEVISWVVALGSVLKVLKPDNLDSYSRARNVEDQAKILLETFMIDQSNQEHETISMFLRIMLLEKNVAFDINAYEADASPLTIELKKFIKIYPDLDRRREKFSQLMRDQFANIDVRLD